MPPDPWAKAWERKIHVRVTLADDEVTSPDPPKPVLELLPFFSNTDNLARIVYHHFQYCIAPSLTFQQSEEPWQRAWFEYKDLKIEGRQVPVGVLAHAHVPEAERPWRLTVHFSGYPSECCPFKTTRKPDLKHMFFNPRHMFFNSLKEAFVIMTGRASAVAGLVVARQEALWAAASHGDWKGHLAELGQLAPRAGRRPDRATIDIPLRILCSPHPLQDTVPDARFYSRPAVCQRHDGSYPTLQDTLYAVMPDIFEEVQLFGTEALDSDPVIVTSAVGEEGSAVAAETAETITAAAPLLVGDEAPTLSLASPASLPQVDASKQQSSSSGDTPLEVAPEAPTSAGSSKHGAGEAPIKAADTAAVEPPATEVQAAGATVFADTAYRPPSSGGDASTSFDTPQSGSSPGDESQDPSNVDAAAAAGSDRHDAAVSTPDDGPAVSSALEPAATPVLDHRMSPSAGEGTAFQRSASEATPDDEKAAQSHAAADVAEALSPDMGSQQPSSTQDAKTPVRPLKVVKGAFKAGVAVHVAGYAVPLETPIAALHEFFKAPDCFLYIVVHVP